MAALPPLGHSFSEYSIAKAQSPIGIGREAIHSMTNAEPQSRHIRDREAQRKRLIAVIFAFLQRALKHADLMAQSQVFQPEVST